MSIRQNDYNLGYEDGRKEALKNATTMDEYVEDVVDMDGNQVEPMGLEPPNKLEGAYVDSAWLIKKILYAIELNFEDEYGIHTLEATRKWADELRMKIDILGDEIYGS